MRLSRKHTVGLFTSIAIFSSLMLAVSTQRRSSAQKALKSRSAGERLFLGVAPFPDDPGPVRLTNDEDPRLANWLLGVEDQPPMWWTDFWAGVGTLFLAAIIVAVIIVGVMGAIWVFDRQPLFLLVVPGLPIIALFGHYARDLLWSDPGHKH